MLLIIRKKLLVLGKRETRPCYSSSLYPKLFHGNGSTTIDVANIGNYYVYRRLGNKCHYITSLNMLITSGVSILIHVVRSLPKATSSDKRILLKDVAYGVNQIIYCLYFSLD